jgi:molybdopterin biosynthesis enzyme MoaB
MQIQAGIITISDRARAGLLATSAGRVKAAEGYDWRVVASRSCRIEKREIQHAIREQVTQGCRLILTAGGGCGAA